MIKVTDKMLKNFLKIMDEYDEFVFGDNKYLKKQLETCLNTQGYWAGCNIKVVCDKDNNFRVLSRF